MAHAEPAELSGQDETVSETVVYAVAELTDSDPVSLEPLYATVDPDALDALFETDPLGIDRSPNGVSFTYCGCDVDISADGGVTVAKTGRGRVTRQV